MSKTDEARKKLGRTSGKLERMIDKGEKWAIFVLILTIGIGVAIGIFKMIKLAFEIRNVAKDDDEDSSPRKHKKKVPVSDD